MKKLTPKEQMFVEAYCSTADFNAKKAVAAAGYSTNAPDRQASMMLNKDHIINAIQAKLTRKKITFQVTEDQIMERLWQEANYSGKGSSHAARINALVWLGKHIAMWQEKRVEQNTGDTYNIIQYANTNDAKKIKPKVQKAMTKGLIEKRIEENKEEVEETKVDLPEGVVIADYRGAE